jgi:hypothetical protein
MPLGWHGSLVDALVQAQIVSVSLLQQKRQFEAQISELEHEIATLQAQLKQNTERSAKLRAHHEK